MKTIGNLFNMFKSIPLWLWFIFGILATGIILMYLLLNFPWFKYFIHMVCNTIITTYAMFQKDIDKVKICIVVTAIITNILCGIAIYVLRDENNELEIQLPNLDNFKEKRRMRKERIEEFGQQKQYVIMPQDSKGYYLPAKR